LPNRGTRYRLTIIPSDPPGRQLADLRSWGSLTVRLRFLRHTISSEAEAGDNVHHAPVKMGLGRVQTIFGRPDAFGLRQIGRGYVTDSRHPLFLRVGAGSPIR
jgi:hypothetical protein